MEQLLQKLRNNACSPAETELLVQWLATQSTDADAELLRQQLAGPLPASDPGVREKLQSILQNILKEEKPTVRRLPFLKNPWLRYAAILVLLLGTGTYILFQQQKRNVAARVQPVIPKTDIAPGRQGAILTLANGSTLLLDSLNNGLVANQQGTKLVLNNGELAYDATHAGEVSSNTMTTPNGRQFQLLLPDGSRVWLNAASSITYPTAFTGGERKVKMTGEAYFEVAKNAKMPFKVKMNGETELEVLGTHFNVNAYTGEDRIKTSLLEGAVKINGSVIKPGEAWLNGKVLKTDIDQDIAWKNGLFNFHDMKLKDAMQQISRWYNITVVYDKGIPDIKLWGDMGRDLNLSQVLEILSDMEVHYRMEQGRKLVILQ